jgi:hypothetical protein
MNHGKGGASPAAEPDHCEAANPEARLTIAGNGQKRPAKRTPPMPPRRENQDNLPAAPAPATKTDKSFDISGE